MLTNKTTIEQIAISRAGHSDNQFIAFIDINAELYCTDSLINGANVEFQKLGNYIALFILF